MGVLQVSKKSTEQPANSSHELPEVKSEVTYLYLPREEDDQSKLNELEDDGGTMDPDYHVPSGVSDNDMENSDKDEDTIHSPSSLCSKSKKVKSPSSLPEDEDESSTESINGDQEMSHKNWSVQLECPFCESYRFPITKGEQFCAHLDNCHGLLGENKDKRLCCPICEQFCKTPDEKIEFVEHLPVCYGGTHSLNWKILTCDICPGPVNRYFKLDGFILHYLHHKKHPFRCSLCPMRMKYKNSGRKKHFQKHHPESLETFTEDSSVIEDKTLPTLHWWCPVCPDSSFNEESLRDSHVQLEHPDYKAPTESNRKCRFCSKMYTSTSFYDIQLHEGTEHDYSIFYCPICPSSYRKIEKRQVHMELKHGNIDPSKQFPCPVCKSAFSGRFSLRKHIQTEHGQKYDTTNVCKMCGQCFQSKAYLKVHLGSKHGIGDYWKHVCPYEGCKRVFWNKSTWKRHLTIHAGQPEFQCSFCHKGIYSKSGLQIHELTHMNAESKPFQCQECGKRYPTMNNLRNHMKFHEKRPIEETSWTCPVCQKTLATGRHKKRHLEKYCKGKKVGE